MANSSNFTINIKAVADMQDVVSNVKNIQSALSKLKLPDNLKVSFKQTFGSLEKELDNYQKIMASGFKSKGDANALTKSGNNILRLYDDIVKKMNQIDDSTLRKAFEDLGAKEVEKLRSELTGLENDLKTKLSQQKFIDFSSTKSQLKSFASDFKDVSEEIGAKFKTISNSTINTFFKNIDLGRLDLAEQNLQKIEQIAKELNNQDLSAWAANLREGFDALKKDADIKTTVQSIDQLKQSLANASANALQNLVNGFKNGTISAEQFGQRLQQVVNETNQWGQAQSQTNKEIDQVKSRIQYFLGLNNAINLIRRAVRSAVSTIKDLDKAMTETAVVTDFTVSDMWKQLPEYTKRANELGVTTQQAYESATLFYQQGLNTQQAAALSTETLKMARIAGLDAAEATDRMTNALRGFNMELDAQSAQRVDDVYSQLAAHTASNVDEISTAMTKVASLAHSANMEFETTAAFLAQIIETTRESAETAGTALKTVVARFSEVKKLYSEDQLKGTDEEGQVIDVNRIGIALRTAGIDLNKYFLGEVGLDDIFMELASKWDSLTGVQQRYIATQAAGSRQQSRFIALMQDYARTQELVGMAYEANGASAKQFEKTQDSLQSKLARLKNAWNEFLMGLANSAIVKGVVDVLTSILNLVNKITSAFGNGVGTIFKWGAAFGAFKGLKTLFKDGGLASQALGKLIPIFGGDTTKGAAALNAAATTAATTTTTAATAAATTTTTAAAQAAAILVKGAAEAAAIEKGGAVNEGVVENTSALQAAKIEAAGAIEEEAIEAKGGLLSKIFNATPIGGGEIIGGGAGIPAGGLAGGFSALSIAGFGAALVALEVGAVALQDYVTSGQAQVDHAERVVKKQEKQVEDAVDTTKKQKEAYEAYVKNEKIAQTATGVEKAQAEANMAEAAEVLYNIDVNNVIQTADGFAVNKGYAAQRDETLKQQERIEKAELALDEARVALAQEEVSLGKQYSVVYDNEAGSITQGQAYAQVKSGSLWESQKHQLDSSKSQQELELEAEVWNSKQRAEAEGFAAQATQKMAESVVALLDGVVKDQNIIDTVSTAYAEALDKEAYNKDVVDIQSDLNDLIKIAQDENGKILLDVLNGSYEGLISDNELETIFKDLPKEYATTLESILTSSGDDVSTALKKFNAKLKKSQLNFRKSAIATLYKNGLQTGEQLDRIANELTLTEQKKLVDVADSLTDYGKDFNNILLTAISDQMLEGTYDNSSLQKFVQQLSDNPILTFDALSKAANAAESDVQTRAKNLLAITRESEAFSKKNQVQWFLAEGMEDLNDEVKKFIEENGKLNSHNIESLAKQSKTLATLLENDVISAKALAAAMNALQEGKVTIFDLNESVLELYESFDTVANAIERAGQFIKDFDPGEDWGDAFDFIETGIDKLTEFVDNRELGNPQARNYWKAFFTTDPKDLADWEAGIALLKQLQGNSGMNFWTDVVGFKADKNGNIADMGIEGFAESEFNSYQKYIQSLAGEKGKQFTDDYYDLMIRNAANHDYGFLTDIASVEVDKIVDAYTKGLESGEPLDKAKIDAIADAYGLDPQELLDAYTKKFKLDYIDYNSLQDKIRSTVSNIQDVVDDTVKQAFIQHRKEQGDTEGEANRAWNTGVVDTGWLLSQLGADANGVFSIDTLTAKIGQIVPEVAEGSVSAQDWVQEQINKSPGGKVTLPVEYQVVNKNEETGSYETKTIKAEVEVSNLDEYSNAVEQIQNAANTELLGSSLTAAFTEGQTEAQNLADFIATLGENTSLNLVKGEIEGCTIDAKTLNETLSAPVQKNVSVAVSPQHLEIGGAGSITFTINAWAKGGKIGSYATGSPGLALTGEEAPEIVWNKEKGYAYLAGANGPEINNLQPGDQIFNGDQTKQILKRSGLKAFAKGTIGSYAGTLWKMDTPTTKSGGGSGGSSGKEKKESTWRNELDWLYDLMEDIAEYERQQTILQSKYNLTLEDLAATGKDLFKLTQKELINLQTQYQAQSTAQLKRLQQMGELQTQVNAAGYGKYVQWNQNDQTLEINWDAIEAIQDKEVYDEVTDWIDRMESVQDQIDDAEDALWDIKEQIQDLQNRYLEKYLDFQNKVLDAVVASYQITIDNLSELNETLNDTNSAILDSIQKEIELERQIRDNTETEANISDMERRLAYLQRDTTGANAVEIRQLQQQLTEARKSYSDNLVDQAIESLQQSNEEAASQREKQIDLMQAQLDYWQESGGLWTEVANLIADGFTEEGGIVQNSALWDMLKEADSWNGLSEAQKKNWANELILEANEIGAHLIQLSGGNEVNAEMVRDSISDERGILTQNIAAAAETVRASIASLKGQLGGTPEHSYTATKVEGYASGGLTTKTGMALLHGTPNEPEYVLNARQTEAFLRLADILPQPQTSFSTMNTYGGNISFNVDVNVGSISDDYDVDSLVARIKDDLYDAASYRNGNVLGLLR